jgi:GTPase SAR1 family protein
MTLWNTAGQEEYNRLRPLNYPQTHIFFLVFDVTNAASLGHIRTEWSPEVNHHATVDSESKRMPIIFLVGTKTDLRQQQIEEYNVAIRGKTKIKRDSVKNINGTISNADDDNDNDNDSKNNSPSAAATSTPTAATTTTAAPVKSAAAALRDRNSRHVSFQHGLSVAQAISARGYFEVSAVTGDGFTQLFTSAVTSVLNERMNPASGAERRQSIAASHAAAAAIPPGAAGAAATGPHRRNPSAAHHSNSTCIVM